MLGLRLAKETEERLENLCKETGRTKSYYVKKAIQEYLEDQEDYLLALARLEEDDELVSYEQVRRRLGLDD